MYKAKRLKIRSSFLVSIAAVSSENNSTSSKLLTGTVTK